MSGVHDFTKYLPKKSGEILFNPSIAYWYDNYYVCIYRVFSRYGKKIGKQNEDDPENWNLHPWKKENPWKVEKDGYDKSRIVILKIKKGKIFSLEKDFGYIDGVDARLLYLKNDRFLISANLMIDERFGIVVTTIQLVRKKFLIRGFKMNIIAEKVDIGASISKSLEKNWCFWLDNSDRLWFSYGICMEMARDYEIFLEDYQPKRLLQSYYINHSLMADYYYYISTSTPAVHYFSDVNLAVGHVKYQYKIVDRDSIMAKFHKHITEQEGMKLHPHYVYLMFFYTFHQDTHTILKRSPYFMIRDRENFALCFASGLLQVAGSFMISYGSYDTKCKLAWFEGRQVEQLLDTDQNQILIVDPGIENMVHYSTKEIIHYLM